MCIYTYIIGLDFLCSILNYEKDCEEILGQNSFLASGEIKEKATIIYDKYIQINSSDEVIIYISMYVYMYLCKYIYI